MRDGRSSHSYVVRDYVLCLGFNVARSTAKMHIVGFFGDFIVFYFRYIDFESS